MTRDIDGGQGKLQNLLVDEDEVNEELLFDVLSDYVRFGSQSGNLIPQKPFENLTAKQRIVVVLLAQKARFELDLAEQEWLSPSGISEESGVKMGTIYPYVRELEKEDIIESDDGEYHIPNHGFTRAQLFVEGGDHDE